MNSRVYRELLMRIEALERRVSQMIVRGKISEVNPENKRAKVQWGPEQFTGWLPWKPVRTGKDIVWWCPEVGEGVTVLSDGDLLNGEIIPGSYTDDYPAPSSNPAMFLVQFGDGSKISYDRDNHVLHANLTNESRTRLHSPGGITLVGDTRIEGKLTVTQDTRIEGATHSVGNITSEGSISDNTSSMGQMRSVYNNHTHPNQGADPPTTKME